MPGLLDFLNSPDSALGIGLLAAAGRGQSFGEGLLGAQQAVAAQRRGLLQDKFLQSQVDENTSQAEVRKQQLAMAKRKMDMQSGLLGYGGPPDAGYIPPGASSVPSGGTPQGGPSAPMAPTPGGPMTLNQLSGRYGIPYEALAFDLVNNDGKGISDMIYKRGTPDMQVSNGYAYDKNRLGAGFLPSLSTAQDGKTSMVRIGSDGLPVVSAPQGALETYGGYQRINNMLGAAFTPGRPVLDADGRQRGQSQLTEITGGIPPSIGPGAGPAIRPGAPSGYTNGGSRESADAERLRILQEELRKPNLPPADRAAIQRDIARISPAAAASSPAGALDFSPAEKAQQEADRASAVDTAKANVVRDTADQKKQKSASEMIAATQRARDLLLQGPTSSGIGELADKAAAFVGSSTKGAEIAAKLDIVAGDLVNNVPRMEGPQSDGDRLEYRTQAGRAADRSLPVKIRLAAMDEIERLQRKYAQFNGGLEGSGSGASGSWDSGSTQQSTPQATMRFNPQTGRLEKIN